MFLADQWKAFEYACFYLRTEIEKYEGYLEEHEELGHLSGRTKDGLEKQVAIYKAELERFEKYMGTYKQRD